MKLNLGANDRRVEGFISVDVCAPADQIADLTYVWPWADSSVEEILAWDVIEHLPSKRHTMNEMYRVLKHGGIARIEVPNAAKGDGGFCDPTHVSYFTLSDWEYYEKATTRGSGFAVRNTTASRLISKFSAFLKPGTRRSSAAKFSRCPWCWRR